MAEGLEKGREQGRVESPWAVTAAAAAAAGRPTFVVVLAGTLRMGNGMGPRPSPLPTTPVLEDAGKIVGPVLAAAAAAAAAVVVAVDGFL